MIYGVRLSLSCALVMLQVVAASGHVLHHALVLLEPESGCACDVASGGLACHAGEAEHHHGDACELTFEHEAQHDRETQHDSDTPHDCDDCVLCNATTDEIATGPVQPSRSVAYAAAPPVVVLAVELDQPSGVTLRACPPPPPTPQALHSITLPLLN